MKSLKDQLLKAKLVDKKQVRRLEHEQRQRLAELGREGIEREQALRRAELEEKARQQKEEQRQQEKLRKEKELAAQAGTERIRHLVARSNLLTSVAGRPTVFYFKAADGSVPRLELSEELAGRLEAGKAAIVELPGTPFPDFFVVPAGVAEQVARADPAAVRFWNRGPPPTETPPQS